MKIEKNKTPKIPFSSVGYLNFIVVLATSNNWGTTKIAAYPELGIAFNERVDDGLEAVGQLSHLPAHCDGFDDTFVTIGRNQTDGG